ncbi:hypothetical protein C7440_2417 [Pusillimonas noertemannii]|uniref:OB-fold protein n=1 Tax=Pusillimonas noertemannii TaxID=305977 RepID=A0A2U1CL07_9BURK|nr:hypothetical protein C7440_2417 [Pusillimonas noertemannii]
MNSPPSSSRLLPKATPETQHFWSGISQEKLLLQACNDCSKHYFPPRPFCPNCGSHSVLVTQSTGKASLLSYVISAKPAPGLEAPYIVAIVALHEGPQMMTNIINCAPSPDSLHIGMPLRVVFQRQNDEVSLPLFEPAEHK